MGIRTGRPHHFLSNLEHDLFLLLDWQSSTLDLREQFPLDLDATQDIAERLNIRHPQAPKTAQPMVMTTDIVQDRQGAAGVETVAYAVKSAEDLEKPRTLQKLEIEWRYWQERGVAWSIVTLPLLEEKNATAKTLYDKQFGARPPVLDSEQQLIEKRAELASAEAASRQIFGELAAAKARRGEILSGFLAEAGDRHTKALQKLAGLEQQIAKIRQRETYRHLVSPVDGTVQNVKIHTPGAVVTTADTLMTIVPDGIGLEVEASVENKDIGFVREGQEVEVKFDAFPFTRYGLVKGRVRKLSHDATPTVLPPQDRTSSKDGAAASNAQQQATSDLAYAAKITLDRDWIAVDGRDERFQPGMRVSAEIKTGDRRVIDYILSPVMQTVSEAGRER